MDGQLQKRETERTMTLENCVIGETYRSLKTHTHTHTHIQRLTQLRFMIIINDHQ